MILNANLQVPRNKIGHLQTNNSIKQNSYTQAKQQSSTNFKGAGLNEFANYFIADTAAIVLGCGVVDAFFKKMAKNQSKDFGLMIIRTKHKAELTKIETLTKEIIWGLGSLKDPGNNKKIGSKIKKAYEKSFKTTLELDKFDKEKEIKSNELPVKFSLLKEASNELFVKIDNQDSYTTIGKPFFNAIDKAYNKIYS